MAFYSSGFPHSSTSHRAPRTHQFGRWMAAGAICTLVSASAWLGFAAGGRASSHVPAPSIPAALMNRASSVSLSAAGNRPQVLADYGKLPLSFEPNRGQTDAQVKFLARGSGYTLFLTQSEAVFSLHQSASRSTSRQAAENKTGDHESELLHRAPPHDMHDAILRVQLTNPNLKATVFGLDQLLGKANYFLGNDPAKWATNVPTYAKLQYSRVFRGIDLVYYGNQGQLEYDFVVSAGADPRQIGLNFRGARGLRIDPHSGDLAMTVGSQEVRFHKPVAYQNDPAAADSASASKRHFIEARYVLGSGNRIAFAVGPYDRTHTLVIDPTLSYSTYLGGASNDYGTAIAIDSSGDAYVTGYTNSTNFPVTPGAFQTRCGGGCADSTVDAFVSKLDPTGSSLIYSTYLGGSNDDYGNGIALDASGDAYIIGQTLSGNFPTTPGAYQTSCGGGGDCSGGDAFITELNPDGSALVYSTFLGGNGLDQGNSIALDASNDAYVTGYTQSTDFPTTPGAFQTTCSCSADSVVFVTEMNSTGSALVYSTYLGGTDTDVGYGIALDSSNNAYLTGYTHSSDFPVTRGAFQTTLEGPVSAFVTKMNSTGSALVYSSYLGGSTSNTTPCEACGVGIKVDSAGDAYVCGLTAEANFPVTPGAYQTTFIGASNGHDAFLTEMNPTGTGLVFSTFLGGDGDTGATALGLDESGNIWLRGNTKSTVFPVTPGAFQTENAGGFDAFLSELNPTGADLLYSTYLGGSGTEYSIATSSLAVDNQTPPNVYMTGYTNSTNFPVTTGAFQTKLAGEYDVYVSKFSPSPNVGLSPTSLSFGYQQDGTTSAPQTITVTNGGNQNLTISNVAVTGTNAGDFPETDNCTTVLPQATCTINVSFTPAIAGGESAGVQLTDNGPGSPQSVALSGTGIGNGPLAVFSPSSLTFPTQLVGTSSAPQTITLSNIGNQALSITQITISSQFSQSNNCGSSVPVGSSCTITVTFNPTKPNTITGTLSVTDNGPGSPQTIALSGTGTYVILSPAVLNFGTVTVGQSSAPQTSTFTNTAKFNLPIKSLSITGTDPSDFSEKNTCGSTVDAGASCTITVTFKPLTTGALSADVSISDGGGGSPQTVALTGTGQAAN